MLFGKTGLKIPEQLFKIIAVGLPFQEFSYRASMHGTFLGNPSLFRGIFPPFSAASYRTL